MNNEEPTLSVFFFGTWFYLWFFGYVIGIPLGFGENHEVLFFIIVGFGAMCISLTAITFYILSVVAWSVISFLENPDSEESKEFSKNMCFILADFMVESLEKYDNRVKACAWSQRDL